MTTSTNMIDGRRLIDLLTDIATACDDVTASLIWGDDSISKGDLLPHIAIIRRAQRAMCEIAGLLDDDSDIDEHDDPDNFAGSRDEEYYESLHDDDDIFHHRCEASGCDRTVIYDDEPMCFTHSPDEGSSVRGYSARRAAAERAES